MDAKKAIFLLSLLVVLWAVPGGDATESHEMGEVSLGGGEAVAAGNAGRGGWRVRRRRLRVWRPRRHKKTIFLLAGLVLGALVLVAGIAMFGRERFGGAGVQTFLENSTATANASATESTVEESTLSEQNTSRDVSSSILGPLEDEIAQAGWNDTESVSFPSLSTSSLTDVSMASTWSSVSSRSTFSIGKVPENSLESNSVVPTVAEASTASTVPTALSEENFMTAVSRILEKIEEENGTSVGEAFSALPEEFEGSGEPLPISSPTPSLD